MQVFLAVAETGSYSGAARALGSSQPTVGRQIRALVETVGSELFHRTPGGVRLTAVGLAMVPAAEAMRAAAERARSVADGQGETLAGTVRITAPSLVATYILPDILRRLKEDLPMVAIEIVATDEAQNLLFREADIAVRMFRPTQQEIIAKHICDAALGLYGARTLLDRLGRPETVDEALALGVIGYDRSERLITGFADHGYRLTREDFPLRCDDQVVNWEMARAGCGLGIVIQSIAVHDPTVEQLFPEIEIPPIPVWLATHEALKTTPRIRRVWDLLQDGITGAMRVA